MIDKKRIVSMMLACLYCWLPFRLREGAGAVGGGGFQPGNANATGRYGEQSITLPEQRYAWNGYAFHRPLRVALMKATGMS